MIFFITFLRALAACLITNAHYTGIYPTDLLANGGLIGDVLFFAVSGYCLYNIKYDFSWKGFWTWYGKRLWRIYPPVFIITAIYMCFGLYRLETHNLLWWYVYPTFYHFVASILVLYIPFFFIVKINKTRTHLGLIMCGIAAVWFLIYWIFYDKTYYHIDTVRESAIRFLFMESMLLGAWFRQHDEQYRNKHKMINFVIAFFLCMVYFVCKTELSGGRLPSSWQFLSQITIMLVLFFLFRAFSGLDARLEKLPRGIKKVIRFLSEITLEIYVVQYVLINIVRMRKLAFPINWLLVTICIVLSAFLLHKICAWLYITVNNVYRKGEQKK